MRESTLVVKIKKSLEAKGAKVLKVHGSALTEAGTPDLIGCYQGRCFCLEVKRDEKHKPTALQLLRLVQWREAGAKTGVVWSVEMALEVMKK